MVTYITQFDQRPKQSCHYVRCEDMSAIVQNMSDGEVIAILRRGLRKFLDSVHAQKKHKMRIVLVLFNYDDTFTDVDAEAVFLRIPLISMIFANNALAEHGLVHAIPLGLPYHRMCDSPTGSCGAGASKVESFEAQLKRCREANLERIPALYVPQMVHSHPSRSQIRDELSRDFPSHLIVFGEKHSNTADYLCDFARYQFILSMPGAGPDTFRSCQILAAGACPIFIQSQRTKVTDMYINSTCAVLYRDAHEMQRELPRLVSQDSSPNKSYGFGTELGLCKRSTLISYIRSYAY